MHAHHPRVTGRRRRLLLLPLAGLLWLVGAVASPAAADTLYRDRGDPAFAAGADLHSSNMTNVPLEDANLSRANLAWATLDAAGAGFAPFVDVNLSNASWVGANAPGATFDGGDLHRPTDRGILGALGVSGRGRQRGLGHGVTQRSVDRPDWVVPSTVRSWGDPTVG